MQTMSEAIEAFDEFLDAVEFPAFGIDPSRILRECDPIAYRAGFFDWLAQYDIDPEDLIDDEDLP